MVTDLPCIAAMHSSLTLDSFIMGLGILLIAASIGAALGYDSAQHHEDKKDPWWSFAVAFRAHKPWLLSPGAYDFCLSALNGGRGLMVENGEGVVMRWPGKTLLHGTGFWLPTGWMDERRKRVAAGQKDEGLTPAGQLRAREARVKEEQAQMRKLVEEQQGLRPCREKEYNPAPPRPFDGGSLDLFRFRQYPLEAHRLGAIVYQKDNLLNQAAKLAPRDLGQEQWIKKTRGRPDLDQVVLRVAERLREFTSLGFPMGYQVKRS